MISIAILSIRYAAALRRRRNSSQVSVTPRVASPGTRNNSGTASTAEIAAHAPSATGEIPSAAAKAITIAIPRNRYSAPSTTPRLSATALKPASSGVIETVNAATSAHTQWSPKRNSRNGPRPGPNGRRAIRRCHCHASARPATLWRVSVAGIVSLTKRTIGSKATNSCGSRSTRNRIVALAWRVARARPGGEHQRGDRQPDQPGRRPRRESDRAGHEAPGPGGGGGGGGLHQPPYPLM